MIIIFFQNRKECKWKIRNKKNNPISFIETNFECLNERRVFVFRRLKTKAKWIFVSSFNQIAFVQIQLCILVSFLLHFIYIFFKYLFCEIVLTEFRLVKFNLINTICSLSFISMMIRLFVYKCWIIGRCASSSPFDESGSIFIFRSWRLNKFFVFSFLLFQCKHN